MLRDLSVFTDNYLPQRLVARDAEVKKFSQALKPTLHDDRAENVLISGPSGVGKTVLARHMLERVRELAVVDVARVHCLGKGRGSILREALRQHPDDVDVSHNTPVKELPALLEEAVDRPFILVLDEGDDLPKQNVLQDIATHDLVSVIAICHDAEEWLVSLPGNRLEAWERDYHHIELTRYRVPKLAEILERRVDLGLVPGAIDRTGLEEIANVVAGVARRGIQTLREAAALAGDRSHSSIQSVDIVDGYERARRRIRESNLRSLPFHHHVVYELVRRHGELTGGELHNLYDQMVPTVYDGREHVPISRRARRNKISKLRDYDLIAVDDTGEYSYRAIDEQLCSELDLGLKNPSVV